MRLAGKLENAFHSFLLFPSSLFLVPSSFFWAPFSQLAGRRPWQERIVPCETKPNEAWHTSSGVWVSLLG